MKDKIFGLTKEELERQLGVTNACNPPKSSPINSKNILLEPCISGGKKILEDPEKKQMCKRIYTGK